MDSVSTCSKCAPGDAQSPYGRRARGTPDDGRTQTIRSYMRRLPCSRHAPSKVVGNCRGGYSSTKSGSARSCCHAWAMDSSPTPAGFATVVACLRMPAEDFFSSDEERDDSNELPDLMAQLAPLLREDIRTTNDSASQRRPTTRLGQRSGRGAQRRGNDPGSPGTTHSCSRRFSESRPTVW